MSHSEWLIVESEEEKTAVRLNAIIAIEANGNQASLVLSTGKRVDVTQTFEEACKVVIERQPLQPT